MKHVIQIKKNIILILSYSALILKYLLQDGYGRDNKRNCQIINKIQC
jgi:hypothetical protein